MFIFQEQVPKMDSSPNVAIRKEHGDTYKYIYICIYIYKYIYLTWAPARPPVPGPCKVYVFVYVYAYVYVYAHVYVFVCVSMLLSDCNVWGRIHFGNLFLEKWTCESWIWGQNKHFSENGSPGQTTMLMRRASKFWVEPRSPFFEISHHDPETNWKTPNIVSWPECQSGGKR